MTMRKSAWFDIACNDPDNGLFDGKTNMIQYRWGNEYIELESRCWDGFTFSRGDGWIRLHRRRFAVIETKGWVGNWCWDGFRMRRTEAKRFLGALKSSGNWSCTQGPTRWLEWFNGPEPAHHDGQVPNDVPGNNYA